MKRQFIAGLNALVILVLAVIWNTAVRSSILTAGERCLTVLIPSLYCYSLLAAFCIRSGGLRAVSRLSGPNGLLWGILLFSQIGGYPVGAQLLHELELTGEISREQEKRLLCVCFGCGPGFLMGTVCRGFPSKLSLWVMLSVILPNLLLSPLVMRNFTEKQVIPSKTSFVQTFTGAAESAANAMLKVTAMVLAFAALMGIFDGMGVFALLPEKYAALVRAVLEVSCVTELPASGGSLPLAAACLAFGGICVHLQVAAICGAVNWVKFWLFRVLSAGMAYGICLLGVKFLFRDVVAVSVLSARPELTTGSILPGVCLLVMSVLLLRKTSPEDAL